MRKLALMVVLGVAAMAAVGVSSAGANSADPSCDGGSCTPASTWFNVNVALHWTFDPDPPTAKSPSCDDQTISAEGDNLVTCSVTWDPLDPPPTFTPFTVHVKIDKTDPTVTGATPSGATANAAGWFRSPVSWIFDGTDAVSGKQSCQTVGPYSGPNSAAASVSGTCTDNAGNTSAPSPHSFKYDDTNPTVTGGSPTRGPDHGTWYNHSLTVNLTGTDDTSGIASCQSPTYSGPDDATAHASGGCTDAAGNTDTGNSSDFKYDASAPTVTGGSPTRGADNGTWYNHALTVQLTGSDAVSGIESCTTAGYSGPDSGSANVSGSCTNNAGLSATGNSASFKYDATKPVTSVGASRTPDSGIWYRGPAVTFHWSATDATSGVGTCTADNAFSTQGLGQTVSGSCSDNAGNSDSASTTVNYDSVAPTTSVTPNRPPDHGVWYVSPVTFHTGATDATSGVNAASCTADNVFSTQTASQTVTGSCSDNAGNSGSGSATVHYDSVTPSVNVTASRPPDHGTWYVNPVTFHWAGTDTTSGIDSCTADNVFSTQGASQVVSGNCTDNAGLKGTATRSVNYDSVAPTVVAGTPDRAPDAGGWYNHPLNVTFTGTDAVSGIASCSSVPFSTNTTSAGTTVPGTCTDNAGNAGAPAQSQNIKYDNTPPVNNGGTLDRASPDKDGWYNHALPIHFSGTFGGPSGPGGTCDTVNYTGPDGAGVKGTGNCTSVSGVSTAAQSPAFNFDATPPAVSVTADRPPDHDGWYTRPVTFAVHGADGVSGVTSCGGGGTYAGPDTAFGGMVGGCADLAGNTGFGSAGFKYDASPPGAPTVAALPAKRQVKVSWTIPRDASSVVVTRSEQGAAAAPQVIYSGNHTSLVDKKLKDGTRYRYTVSALDAAGNATPQSIVAVPTTSTLRPFAETAVTGPPRLSWKKIKPARYYNVQLWRDGAKVLSTWPRKPFLQIRPNWTFGGSQYTFSAGHYKWYVWPGFGPRSKHRYGHLIGRSTFSFGVPL